MGIFLADIGNKCKTTKIIITKPKSQNSFSPKGSIQCAKSTQQTNHAKVCMKPINIYR